MKYEIIFKNGQIKNMVSKDANKIKNYITESFNKIQSVKRLDEDEIRNDKKCTLVLCKKDDEGNFQEIINQKIVSEGQVSFETQKMIKNEAKHFYVNVYDFPFEMTEDKIHKYDKSGEVVYDPEDGKIHWYRY